MPAPPFGSWFPGAGAEPVRFLMVTTFYPPFSFGGDAISVRELSRALVRRGHEVTVVHDVDAYAALTDRPLPPYRLEEDDQGIRVVRLKSRWGILSLLLVHQLGRPVFHSARLRRLFRSGGFDVIAFHNPSLIGGPGILTWARDAVTVYMAREHWLICPTHVLWRHRRERCDRRECLRCLAAYRRPPQLWRYTGAINRALRQVDHVVALSEFSRRKHREFGLEREMVVLPNFVPDPGPGVDDGGSPHHRPYFFFAGRLERLKGLDDVLPLWRHFGEADLLIAGRGDHGDRLREIAADIPSVRFLGQLPPEELPRYYRHAVAALVPSEGYEAFPRVLIEALMTGTPVLARAIGPAPEFVAASGAGELFSTPGELTTLMHRLVNDPAHRARLAANAAGAVEAHWSESVIVPQLLALIAGTRASRPG
jgi:glycosyltransferase involved in cell wall biosynthesis